MSQTSRHAIVLTHGNEDGGARATLAFALAVSLQAMGSEVVVYMNFQAAVWAVKGATESIKIRGFDDLETYIKLFEEAGGKMYVCASCFDHMPRWSKEDGNACEIGDIREGVIPAGVTTLASLISERKTVSL